MSKSVSQSMVFGLSIGLYRFGRNIVIYATMYDQGWCIPGEFYSFGFTQNLVSVVYFPLRG